MPADYDPSTQLLRFKRYRATRLLELAGKEEDRIHGSLLIALADRETGLRNIVGGGYYDRDRRWIQTGVDRGLFQLNEEYHRAFLASVKGCQSGDYAEVYSVDNGGALPAGRVPGLTTGALRCIEVLNGNFRQCKMAGIDEDDIVMVGLCGYNAGVQRCIIAYKDERDPNRLTAHGDYGVDVLARQVVIRRWLKARNWRP